MKNYLTILLALAAINGFSQQKKPVLFEANITGTIEINGHVVATDCFFKLKTTDSSIRVVDDKRREYTVRDCGDSLCKITHLERKFFYSSNTIIKL